jgi:hypothetical protein
VKKLTPLLLSTSLFATPDARFEVFPTEGHVISIGCQTDDNDECRMEEYALGEIQSFYSKRKYPGLKDAPSKVYNAISSAADAIGDVSYVHVAVTHGGITYEYMFDRDTGWNSFRSLPAAKVCRLECKLKPTDDNS